MSRCELYSNCRNKADTTVTFELIDGTKRTYRCCLSCLGKYYRKMKEAKENEQED